MYEHHVTSTKSAVSIASIHTTFFRLLSHVESISKMAQKFTCVSSRHIKNPNYGEGRSSTSRPFFFGFLFGRSRRIEIRRKISTRSLIKLPFLSVRPTFLPSCTFNLTWPFRSKRLIFFHHLMFAHFLLDLTQSPSEHSLFFFFFRFAVSNSNGVWGSERGDMWKSCAHFDYCMQRVNGLATYIFGGLRFSIGGSDSYTITVDSYDNAWGSPSQSRLNLIPQRAINQKNELISFAFSPHRLWLI